MKDILVTNLVDLVYLSLSFGVTTGNQTTTAFMIHQRDNIRQKTYVTLTVGPLSIPDTRLLAGYTVDDVFEEDASDRHKITKHGDTTELLSAYETTVRNIFKQRAIKVVSGVYGFTSIDDFPTFGGISKFFGEGFHDPYR